MLAGWGEIFKAPPKAITLFYLIVSVLLCPHFTDEQTGHRVAWLWALADGVWRRGGGSPPLLLALLLGSWPPSCLGNTDDHLTGTWDPAVVGDPGAGPRTTLPHPHFNSGHWMDSANVSHLAIHVLHLMCLMSCSLTPCK